MAKTTYLCTGLACDTGRRTFIAVEAKNPKEAIRLANEDGVIAEEAEPLLPYVLREPVKSCCIACILVVSVVGVILWLVAASNMRSAAMAHCDKGWKLCEQHDYGEALVAFNQALEFDPKCSYAYCGRGCVREVKKDYDRALDDFNRAIRLKPDEAFAYNNRGHFWCDKKDYDRAIADYDRAIQLAPNFAMAYNNRGTAWRAKKDYDRAMADFNRAIRLDPNSALYHNNRGTVWETKKDYDRAIGDYERAIRLDPTEGTAYSSLAWIRATCPDRRYRDGKAAYENANKAYRLAAGTEYEWLCLGPLAAAYAERGNFEQARQWAQKAIKTAPDEEKRELRSQLDLYRQNKPYRE
jgi:tetratricopeptide (TPR) repeat protein